MYRLSRPRTTLRLEFRAKPPNGRHARTATGAAQLPFGAAVQIDMVLRLAK